MYINQNKFLKAGEMELFFQTLEIMVSLFPEPRISSLLYWYVFKEISDIRDTIDLVNLIGLKSLKPNSII